MWNSESDGASLECARALSSTAVYPPCPRTICENLRLRIRARRIHCLKFAEWQPREGSSVMKCSICASEEATVHITQTSGGNSLAIHLCQACAVKMRVNDPAGFSLADLLSAVRAAQQTGQKRQEKNLWPISNA